MRQQGDPSQPRGNYYEGRTHAAHCTLRKGTWTRVSLATCPLSANLFTAHRIIINSRSCSRGGGRRDLAGTGWQGRGSEGSVQRQGPDEGATTHKGQGPAGAWDRDRQGSHAQVFAPASRHLPDKAEGAVDCVVMRASGV